MNIILCGFMGCGKSTIGKAISKKIKYEFIDSDEFIEKHEKMTIPEIFEKFGEDYFRNKETDSISKISKLDHCVVSLGGGAVLNKENAKVLKTSGKLFFLNISAQEVYNRLKNDTSRPLLQTDDKLTAISSLLSKRLPIYNEVADVIIDVDGKTVDEISEEILKFL